MPAVRRNSFLLSDALSSKAVTFLGVVLFLPAPHFNLLAQNSKPSVDSLTALAKDKLVAHETDSARVLFEAVLEIDKMNMSARMGLGKTYFAEKEWRSARNEFETILKASPTDIEAHFYSALCFRESGKSKGWIFRADDWKKARKHFQTVIGLDSSYQDVLHQYSILEEYDNEFIHALALAHAELRLRGDLVDPTLNLFHLYNHFIFASDTGDSFKWLRSHPSLYARFFTGEMFRTSNRPEQAFDIFESMLHLDPFFPCQAALLSIVRMKVARGEIPAAEQYYRQAVDSVHSQLGAELVFEDIKYIMSDEELQLYKSLSTLERKQSFFHAFWNIRNPTPGSYSNARLIEHYSRTLYAEKNFIFYGFRIWFNNPDKTSVLHFPQSYSLNQRFSDKGLIYLRHGPPNQIEHVAGLGPDNADPNESWLYYPTPESPQWIFHFISVDGNWRLAPLPTDSRMFEALASWDARYGRLGSRIQLEKLNTSETLMDASRENVTLALSTDEHDVERHTQRFRIPCSVDAFRSEGGRSLLNISYGIPMPVIASLLPPNTSQASCEVGVSITSLTSQAIASKLDTISFPISRASSGFITSLFRYTVKPDSYAIALHVRPLGIDALGRWRTRTRVRDFSGRDLLISDLEFLMPSNSLSSIEINGMKVIQTPFTVYHPRNPLYIYYQIYNLSADIDGRTSFITEYFLTPEDDAGGEHRILLMNSDREGKEESSAEFATLNTDDVKPGKYTLNVRVTDRHRARSFERSRSIELVDK